MDDNSPMDAGTSYRGAMLDYDRAIHALVYGATSPDDIASKLLDYGCHGDYLSGKTCPFAKYIRTELRTDTVFVISSYVCFTRGDVVADKLPVPAVITAFVRKFDRGEYPDLIDTTDGA